MRCAHQGGACTELPPPCHVSIKVACTELHEQLSELRSAHHELQERLRVEGSLKVRHVWAQCEACLGSMRGMFGLNVGHAWLNVRHV